MTSAGKDRARRPGTYTAKGRGNPFIAPFHLAGNGLLQLPGHVPMFPEKAVVTVMSSM